MIMMGRCEAEGDNRKVKRMMMIRQCGTEND